MGDARRTRVGERVWRGLLCGRLKREKRSGAKEEEGFFHRIP